MRSLVCGTGHRDIVVEDLRLSTTVSGLKKATKKGFGINIDWFWSIVSKMSQEDLHKLIEFVSGLSQPPIHGFRGLSGDSNWMSISIEHGLTKDSLPLSQICFLQIRLPYYTSKKKMKKMLLFAIQNADTMETQ